MAAPTIKTSIPTSRLRPGNFQEFNFRQASKGLSPIQKRVALIGCKLSTAPATVEKPVQVFSEKDGDDQFGAGSELAIMVRAAMKAARAAGQQPQIFGVGVAEPSSGAVAATRTITVSGAATGPGDVEFRISGRTLRAGCANGDSANTIATAIKTAIDTYQAIEPLRVTAAVSAAVVTTTDRHKGGNGNDVVVEVVGAPPGVTVTVAAGTAGSGAYSLTNALDSLASGRTYHGIAAANHLAADLTAAKTHIGLVGDPAAKRWTIAYFAETGTVATATALGTAANEISISVTSYEGCPVLPAEIAAMMAVVNNAIDDPAANFDGYRLPIVPTAAPTAYTAAELETLLASGCTPLIPTEEGDASKIVRNVSTKTTDNSVTFLAMLDLSNVKIAYYVGTQMDIAQALAFQGLDAKMSVDLEPRAKTVAYDVLKKCEELVIVKNVDAAKSQIRFEVDSVVPTRGNLSYPIDEVLNLHQLASVGNIIVGA